MSFGRFSTIALLLISLLGLVVWSVAHRGEESIYRIGLVAPITGSHAETGQDMRRGAELAVAEINERGLLGSLSLELHVEDDASNPLSRFRPKEAADRLARVPRLLAVVGHAFDQATRSGGAVYRQKKIPVITPTATDPAITAENDWLFSTIHNSERSGRYLAHYVRQALSGRDGGHPKKIAILHDTEQPGRSLAAAFVKGLALYHIDPILNLAIKGGELDPATLESRLEVLGRAEVILLALEPDKALAALKIVRNNEIDAHMLGGESLGGRRFIQRAGVYAGGVRAIAPFLVELFGERARRFNHRYRLRFQDGPSWEAAFTYESVLLLAHAIKEGGANRQAIRRELKKLRSRKKSLPSIGGAIHFDTRGVNQRPLFMGRIQDGRFIPARQQLLPVKYPEQYVADQREGELFEFEGRFMKKSAVVFVGIRVDQIISFDTNAGTFTGDFKLWFRWFGDSEVDFELVGAKTLDQKVVEKYRDDKTGDNYIAYAIQAQYNGSFPMHDYPLDRQTLKIQLRSKSNSIEEVVFVTDNTEGIIPQKQMNFDTWLDQGHTPFVDADSRTTSFRNPLYGQKPYVTDYSLFSYNILLQRDVFQYVISYFPLIIIILISAMVFYIDRENIDTRIALGITSLLSAMAFQMSQTDINVGYLIKTDVFFIITYILIFVSIIESVAVAYATDNRLDRIFRYFYPLLMVVSIMAVFVY